MWIMLSFAYLVASFVCGVSTGLAASSIRKSYRRNPWRGRRSSVVIGEVTKTLEAEGKIQMHLSPADNAAQMLESILLQNLDDNVRSSIIYAIGVLKSDFTNATVPVGLSLESTSTPRERKFSNCSDEGEGVVLNWLLSNYTPKTSTSQPSFAFPSSAQKVKLALNFHDSFSSLRENNVHSTYVYDVQPEELCAINEALEGVDEWDWDVWKLHTVSKGRPLQTLGWHLLHKWDLIQALNLKEDIVRNWLIFIERMYEKNEYHTSTHAADVLQAVHHFLCKVGISEYLSTIHVFSLLITAMIHDVGHDGKNNLYHENAMTERALLFNDQSIQENFHCMTVFSSMSRDGHINLLGSLPREQTKEVRRLMILMTLGTDMKKHFKHFQKFKSLVAARGGGGGGKDLWAADPEARDQLCAHILHAADLSNPCRRFDIARQWACRVLNEFFAQGDAEVRRGLPVSPMCSRDTTLLAASQIGFISFVVLPYFQVLEELFPRMKHLRERLETNLQRWRALEAEESRYIPITNTSSPLLLPPPSLSVPAPSTPSTPAPLSSAAPAGPAAPAGIGEHAHLSTPPQPQLSTTPTASLRQRRADAAVRKK